MSALNKGSEIHLTHAVSIILHSGCCVSESIGHTLFPLEAILISLNG